MQQVAANKTDLAALPFSATSTAKAVGNGLDSHSQGQNSEAFSSLYQEAKSGGRDFVLNENAGRNHSESAHNIKANTNRRENSVNNRTEANSSAASNETSTHERIPSEGQISNARESKRQDVESTLEGELKSNNHSKEAFFEKKTAPKTGTVSLREKEYSIGGMDNKTSNTDSDVELSALDLHGNLSFSQDLLSQDPLSQEAMPNGTDWIALVEGITKGGVGKAAGELEALTNVKMPAEFSAMDNSEITDVLSDLITQLKSLEDENVKVNPAITDKLSTLSNLLNKRVESAEAKGGVSNESGDNLSVLLAQLSNSESLAEQKGDESSNLEKGSEEAQNLPLSDLSDEESTQNELLLSLINDALKENGNDRLSQALSAANAGEKATVQHGAKLDKLHEGIQNIGEETQGSMPVSGGLTQELTQEPTQELTQELELATVNEGESISADLTGVTAKISSSSATVDGESITASGMKPSTEKAVEGQQIDTGALETQDDSLLMAISKLSPESAQKATEALADRMVALVPNSQQQQAVKSNIIAGINEFQKQVEQGHQPGIDLSAIVADAAKDASLSAEVSSALNARVETQAGQFMQLMTNAQNSIQQMVQQQFTQADAAINENNQIRSESSKSQQQFDGFDKAVNIHKPEGQQQLGEKIRWMVNARNTMAEIRLDPPELGSMQVRVNVQGEAASVSFVVQSQQAKDALAESMPKLRDMLSEQGIELGDAQVRKDNSSNSESGQQLAGQNGNSGSQRSENDAELDNGHVIEQAVTREAKGGIDFYA